MSQQLLEQEMTVSQFLRNYGKQFTQVGKQYTDGLNGRCAIGVMMSYYGWDGEDWTDAWRKLFAALVVLGQALL
jgi:hypothetical protein